MNFWKKGKFQYAPSNICELLAEICHQWQIDENNIAKLNYRVFRQGWLVWLSQNGRTHGFIEIYPENDSQLDPNLPEFPCKAITYIHNDAQNVKTMDELIVLIWCLSKSNRVQKLCSN